MAIKPASRALLESVWGLEDELFRFVGICGCSGVRRVGSWIVDVTMTAKYEGEFDEVWRVV